MAIGANPLAQPSPAFQGIPLGQSTPPMISAALGLPQSPVPFQGLGGGLGGFGGGGPLLTGIHGSPLGGPLPAGLPIGGSPLGGLPIGGSPLGGLPIGGSPLGGLGGLPNGGSPIGGNPFGLPGQIPGQLPGAPQQPQDPVSGILQMMGQMISTILGAFFGGGGAPQPAPTLVPQGGLQGALPAGGAAPTGTAGGANGYEQAVLAEVNNFRAQNGLPPVRLNPQLNNAAQSHSDFQAATSKMSHDGAGGSQVSDRVRQQGYNFRSVNENVAWNQKTPQEVVQAWINSPGHRANLLSPSVTEVGVGFNNYYWTLNMGGQ